MVRVQCILANVLSIKVNGRAFFSRCCLSQMPDKWPSGVPATLTNTRLALPFSSSRVPAPLEAHVSTEVDRSADINIGNWTSGTRGSPERIRPLFQGISLANIEGGWLMADGLFVSWDLLNSTPTERQRVVYRPRCTPCHQSQGLRG